MFINERVKHTDNLLQVPHANHRALVNTRISAYSHWFILGAVQHGFGIKNTNGNVLS